METAVEQIGPRLRMLMNGLTEKEQEVLRDCLSLGTAISNYSVQEIAKRHDVSPAMVVMAAKHCGFSGFREMKNSLATYSRLPGVDLHEELDPNDDAATVINKVFKTAISALQDTLAIFDVEALSKAAEELRNAEGIDIYGVGGSGALALDAYHKFLRIGIRTQVCTDSHMMVMSANLLKPKTVALGFSHSGRTWSMVKAFSLAKQQGATTILITTSRVSPLAEYSDILLCSVAQGSPITGEGAAARIAQLNILDALFVLVAQANYQRSLENLEKTITSVSGLRAI